MHHVAELRRLGRLDGEQPRGKANQRRLRFESLEPRLFLAIDLQLVKVIEPSLVSVESSDPRSFVEINGIVYFSANDSASGRELWRTDGSEAGTFRVKDVLPGSEGSHPNSLTNVGGMLYFGATDGAHGFELWKSDGTETGTVLVRDIFVGRSGSNVDNLFNLGNILYFAADDGASGTELWKSDGTDMGTTRVKDLMPGSASSRPRYLAELNGNPLLQR
jgi:ELWxxDGT repeat protein